MFSPEAAGHDLGGTSPRPVDVQPESLFDPGVDRRAALLHVGQLQSHHACRRTHSYTNTQLEVWRADHEKSSMQTFGCFSSVAYSVWKCFTVTRHERR